MIRISRSIEPLAFQLTGVNGGVTTTTETLWDESTTYTFLAAQAAMTISSANANDTAAGTGARTVRVSGVSTAFAEVTEVATMNGQTGVNLVNQYMTINSMEVLTAGSGLTNAGLMYVGTGSITTGKPAVVHGVMAAGVGLSTSFIFAVPAGKQLLIPELHVASRNVTAGGHEFAIEQRSGSIQTKRFLCAFQNVAPYYARFDHPLVFGPSTQILASVLASAGTGPVIGRATCYLVPSTIDTYSF